MEPADLLAELLRLAREAGIRVRPLGAAGAGEGEPPPTSGVCRVRGAVWVLLSRADPPEAQIAVLAGALRTHAAIWLEGRWLPPAVRECLAQDGEAPSPPAGPIA